MAFQYTSKPDLQAKDRHLSTYYRKHSNRSHYGIDSTCTGTKYQYQYPSRTSQRYNDTELGDFSEAQKDFFDRYATVLSTDIRENIVKYKENVRNAVDEFLALYGIMDTNRDNVIDESSVRVSTLSRSNSFVGSKSYTSPFRRTSIRHESGRPRSRSVKSNDFSRNDRTAFSDQLSFDREKRKKSSDVGSSSASQINRRLSNYSSRRLSNYSSRTSRVCSGSTSSSSNDSGLEAGGYISDSDSPSVKSMKSGVTCAIVQKQSYDKKVYKTKTAVSSTVKPVIYGHCFKRPPAL